MTTTVLRRVGAVALAAVLATPALGAAAEGAGKSILTPDLANTAITLVVFLALLAVLYKFAWGPILRGLEVREATQHKAIEDARLAREEAAALRVSLQEESAKAQEQIRGLLDEARRDAEALRAKEREAGMKEAQTERERARREIEAAKDAALQEISQRSIDLAAVMSSKALRRQITADDHRRLLDESLTELTRTAKTA